MKKLHRWTVVLAASFLFFACLAVLTGCGGLLSGRNDASPDVIVLYDRGTAAADALPETYVTPETQLVETTAETEAGTETQAELEDGEGLVWITESGTKYHSSASCSKMKEPKQVTRDAAVADGYEPCKRCYGK